MMRRRIGAAYIGRRDFIGLMAGVMGGAVLLDGCGTSPSTSADTSASGKPRPGGKLRLAFPDAPDTLDPQATLSIVGQEVAGHIFDNLTTLDKDDRPVARLATSWKPEKNGQEWVFQLRQGVKFHHGRELTADDVVATAERAQDPKLALKAFGAFGPYRSVVKEGQYTVRFVLTQPFSEMPVMLAGRWGRIVPADRIDRLKTEPVGTGPFRFQSFQPQSGVQLTKNSGYWMQGRPYVDALSFVAISDAVGQQAALRGGQVDGVSQIDIQTYLALKSVQDVKVYSTTTGVYNILMTQSNLAPFTNPTVRQAFKYVLDRKSLVSALLVGQGSMGNDVPYASGSSHYVDLPQYTQDISKVKSLLGKAGITHLNMDMYTSSERPPSNKMAVAFQQAAAKANINVSLHDVPYTEYVSSVSRKKALYTTGTFTAEATLYQTLYQQYHSNQPLNYSASEQYPGLDALLEDMIAELDATKRRAMVKKALTIIHDYGATSIPYFINYLAANSRKVQGFVPPKYGYLVDLRSVWMSGEEG